MPRLRDSATNSVLMPMGGGVPASRALMKYVPSAENGFIQYPAMAYDHASDAAAALPGNGLPGHSIAPVYLDHTPASPHTLRNMISQYGVYNTDPRELAHQAMRPTMGASAPWPASAETPEGTVLYRPNAAVSAISPPPSPVATGLKKALSTVRGVGQTLSRAAPVIAGSQAMLAGAEHLNDKFRGYVDNAHSAQLRDEYTARLNAER